MSSTIRTLNVTNHLRIRVEVDLDPESPGNWDNLGEIAYNSSRYVLGTENVSRERLDEISAGIRSGELIGLPVYAYVHGDSMISCGRRLRDDAKTPIYCNPFSCPWDSGQSGFVYTTKAKALGEIGGKVMTTKRKEQVLKTLFGEVETFSMYLQGDVYGYVVERITQDEDDSQIVKILDACWGFFGMESVLEEAKLVAKHYAEKEAQEAKERAYWAERGAMTEVA